MVRLRWMVVHEVLDYYNIMCPPQHTYPHTAMHKLITVSSTLKMAFGGVPVAVADHGKRSDQSTTMSSGTSAFTPFNTEQSTLAAFPETRIQKTSFKYCHLHVACHCHLRFISTLVSTLYHLQPLEYASCRPQS